MTRFTSEFIKSISAMFCVLFVIKQTSGCHQASHFGKRDVSTKDNHANIESFFPACLQKHTAQHTDVTWDWTDIVRLTVEDTNWFYVSEEKFCKDDSVICWQERVSELVDPSSPFYNAVMECIREFGNANDWQAQAENSELSEKRTKAFPALTPGRATNVYYSLCPQISAKTFCSCVDKQTTDKRNWGEFINILQFAKEFFSCEKCSTFESICWHTRFAASLKLSSPLAAAVESCAQKFGTFGSLQYYTLLPDKVLYGKSVFRLEYSTPERCAEMCITHRSCASFAVEKSTQTCYGNSASDNVNTWQSDSRYNGYVMQTAQSPEEINSPEDGALEQAPEIKYQLRLGAILLSWEPRAPKHSSQEHFIHLNMKCEGNENYFTSTALESHGTMAIDAVPYGAKCDLKFTRTNIAGDPISEATFLTIRTLVDPYTLFSNKQANSKFSDTSVTSTESVGNRSLRNPVGENTKIEELQPPKT